MFSSRMQSFTVCFLLPLIFTVHAELVTNFKSTCKEYFYRNSEPQVQASSADVHICQRYDNHYYFATRYDTANRIPLYSAYIFERNDGRCQRQDHWFIEPKLVNRNWDANMMWEGDLRHRYNYKGSVGDQQATDSDYIDVKDYNRGHLNPNQHHTDPGCTATFTLTNIVPQNIQLNGGSWNAYEEKLKNILGDARCAKAYVQVGAIPSKDNWIKKDNKKRVNIPDYLWHAYCCVDNNGMPVKSGAAAVRNINTDVVECSLDSLKKFFTKTKSRMHQPFSNNCNAPISIGNGKCENVVPTLFTQVWSLVSTVFSGFIQLNPFSL